MGRANAIAEPLTEERGLEALPRRTPIPSPPLAQKLEVAVSGRPPDRSDVLADLRVYQKAPDLTSEPEVSQPLGSIARPLRGGAAVRRQVKRRGKGCPVSLRSDRNRHDPQAVRLSAIKHWGEHRGLDLLDHKLIEKDRPDEGTTDLTMRQQLPGRRIGGGKDPNLRLDPALIGCGGGNVVNLCVLLDDALLEQAAQDLPVQSGAWRPVCRAATLPGSGKELPGV